MNWLIHALDGYTQDDVNQAINKAALNERAADNGAREHYEKLAAFLQDADQEVRAQAVSIIAAHYNTASENPCPDIFRYQCVYSTIRVQSMPKDRIYRMFAANLGTPLPGFGNTASTLAETNLNEYDLPLANIRAISVHLNAHNPDLQPAIAAWLRRYAVLRLERGSQELLTIRPLSDFDLDGRPRLWSPPEDRKAGWVIQLCFPENAPQGRWLDQPSLQTGFDLRVSVYGEVTNEEE